MGVEQSSFFSLPLSVQLLILAAVDCCTWTEIKDTACIAAMENGKSQHKEIRIQWAHVNGVLEGHGENMSAETEDSRRIKEGTDYWEKQQKGLQRCGHKDRDT